MRFLNTVAGSFDSITLAEARLHIKEPSNITVEDSLITSYIKAADKTTEEKCNLVVSSSTWEGYIDEWPLDIFGDSMITINKNPVSSITSVEYYDEDNTEQSLVEGTDYFVDVVGKPARIQMVNTPSLKERVNAIKITFVAGASNADSVDDRIKQIARLVVKGYKQCRVDYVIGRIVSELPRTVKSLMNSLKIDEL